MSDAYMRAHWWPPGRPQSQKKLGHHIYRVNDFLFLNN